MRASTVLRLVAAFAIVAATVPLESSSVETYLKEYIPVEVIDSLVTGQSVEWKSLRSDTYFAGGTLRFSSDFKLLLVEGGEGRGHPKIKLAKVADVFVGPPSKPAKGKTASATAKKAMTVFTGRRQSAGTDFFVDNPKTLAAIIEGITSYLHKKSKPINIGPSKKKYKTAEEDLAAKKRLHAEYREDAKWLEDKAKELKKEQKAEKRRLRKLREKQARDRDEGEYNMRRLMIKIDHAVRDGEETADWAKELAKVCERARKAESGWWETSVVYPSAVERATLHGFVPYDPEVAAQKEKDDKIRKYQDAVLRFDKVWAARANVTHDQRIGLTRLFSNKSVKEEVIAGIIKGTNVTIEDLILLLPQAEVPKKALTDERSAEGINDGTPAKTVDTGIHGVNDADTDIKSNGETALGTKRRGSLDEAASPKHQVPTHDGQKVTDAESSTSNMLTIENEPEDVISEIQKTTNDARADGKLKADAEGQSDRESQTQREREDGDDVQKIDDSTNEAVEANIPAPPSVCAVTLGRAMDTARESQEADALAVSLFFAEQCAAAAGDMEPWLKAGRDMLTELQSTVASTGDDVKANNEKAGQDHEHANPSATTLPKEETSDKKSKPQTEPRPPKKDVETPPSPQATVDELPRLGGKMLRKFKKKLQSLITRKAPAKLGNVHRWIRKIEKGDLTPEELNEELQRKYGATVNLSDLR